MENEGNEMAKCYLVRFKETIGLSEGTIKIRDYQRNNIRTIHNKLLKSSFRQENLKWLILRGHSINKQSFNPCIAFFQTKHFSIEFLSFFVNLNLNAAIALYSFFKTSPLKVYQLLLK